MKFLNFSQRVSELADVFVLDDADSLLGQVVAMMTELHHKARVVATLRVVHEATVVLLQVLGTGDEKNIVVNLRIKPISTRHFLCFALAII